MNTGQQITKWWDQYDHTVHGIEGLLKARQRLSTYCNGIALQLKTLEADAITLAHDIKVTEAEEFLKVKGTRDERLAKSLNIDLRSQYAVCTGDLKGCKIMLANYYKQLDAMASRINVLNK